MDAGSPVVAVLAGVLGAILGLAADRFAVRWPEHDPDDVEHPANRPVGWRTAVVVIPAAVAFALLPARFAADPLALLAFGAWFVTLVVGLATDLDQRLLPDVLTGSLRPHTRPAAARAALARTPSGRASRLPTGYVA